MSSYENKKEKKAVYFEKLSLWKSRNRERNMSMQYNYDPNTPYACNQQNFQQNQGSSYVVNSVTWPDFRPSGDFTEVYVNNAEQNYIPEEEVQIVEEKIIPNTEDSSKFFLKKNFHF